MSGKLFAEKLHMKAFGPPSWDPIRDNPYAHLWKPAKKEKEMDITKLTIEEAKEILKMEKEARARIDKAKKTLKNAQDNANKEPVLSRLSNRSIAEVSLSKEQKVIEAQNTLDRETRKFSTLHPAIAYANIKINKSSSKNSIGGANKGTVKKPVKKPVKKGIVKKGIVKSTKKKIVPIPKRK